MGCSHEIILDKHMSYRRACFSGVHVFQDDLSYESICLMRAYVLRVIMLCRRKYLMGGHVFVSACLQDGISCNMMWLMEDMSYWMTRFT